MKNLKDLDIELTELEGEFIMLPEEEYYESCFWILDIISKSNGFAAKGIYFGLTDDEIDFDFYIPAGYYHNNQEYITLLEDNEHKVYIMRGMIGLIFDGERTNL